MFSVPSPEKNDSSDRHNLILQVRNPFKTSSIRLRGDCLQHVSLVLKHVESRVLETMVFYAIQLFGESQGRTFELKANAEDVELHLMEESKGWRTCIPKSINEPVDECSICFEDLSDVDEESIELHDCSHVFHKVCLFQWIWSKSSCPLCRHPIYCGKPKS
ncbi:unnamed protein product [Brassica napus]|nr:unnamed protein product [Brassica napus]